LSEKKNIIIAIIVLAIVVLFYQNNQLMKDLESIKDDRIKQAELIEVKEEKINKLIKDYDGAISTIKDLKEENKELIQEIEASKLPDYSSKFKLKKMGIDDYESIEKDLLEKPELISIDAVLGGTMFFYEAYLLNDEWVYASFEDGHIMGSGLYRFEVLSTNEIEWEEIVVTSD
jgi:hypothetical protein